MHIWVPSLPTAACQQSPAAAQSEYRSGRPSVKTPDSSTVSLGAAQQLQGCRMGEVSHCLSRFMEI
eukprot:CAMPEP_0202410476 /NCGR_PEP_ID=MMETSP1128-20130828/19227_1 /ASSEMBLY_ACC=CAM_ASM_000463 /TAXON_ID=3047 /ORGANISM="Dunaliella tertiolecta, Strain CCMP1320" /LENGTH=65 /DNA_ID=CAMNT_0049016003 /DNA_START=37 /DNA_END=231 /DNA_ORIENTATION=-